MQGWISGGSCALRCITLVVRAISSASRVYKSDLNYSCSSVTCNIHKFLENSQDPIVALEFLRVSVLSVLTHGS